MKPSPVIDEAKGLESGGGTDPRTGPATGGRPMRRRHSALIGACLGAVIAVAYVGYVAYDRASTPAKPNLQNASVGEVVAFVGNERGLARLPKYEQDQFLVAWKTRYSQDENQRALKKYLEGSPEQDRAAVREVLYRIARRQFFEDAREYTK